MGERLSAMKRFTKAFKNGFGPGRYRSVGKDITCGHCGGEEFAEGSAQLNTRALTFMDLDWMNKSATTLACRNCGRIMWFVKKPERL